VNGIPANNNGRIIKICSIVGFFLAEIYMLLVVLAPNVPGAPTAKRLFIPLSHIPKTEVPLGTPPPLSVKITRVVVVGFFMGPFGAMAGLGVGLLIASVIPPRKTVPDNLEK
jgi:hypothetical protein